MKFNFLGKQIRGRFGFPSGEIATNADTAKWMVNNIPQIGIVVGKSTTIEPLQGNREDIFVQPTPGSGWNAVGYTNPGLEATIEEIRELREAIPDDVFVMPQIGESDEERFAYCASRFDKLQEVNGIELNVSCGHAKKGGLLIGSNPESVKSVVSETRKATKKNIVVKVNAAVSSIEDIVRAAVDAGADAISLINTLPGPYPELFNKFGGLSGPVIFPVLYETLRRVRSAVKVPLMVMGGIAEASDIRKLEKIDTNLAYLIGTALAERDSGQIRDYFHQLEIDLRDGTDFAREITMGKKALQYNPFIVKDVVELSPDLRLIRFYENLESAPGQFVALKVGDSRTVNKENDEYSKPFSVASDSECLELVVRKVGKATSKIFELKKNNVVRISGPFGKEFCLPEDQAVIYVGAGCGIAPVHHAAQHHQGKKLFIIGAKTAGELVYLEDFQKMGEVLFSTDDGSRGYPGFVTDLLTECLRQRRNAQAALFFNCGPEIVLWKADRIERGYASPSDIYHVVERMTCCDRGICGKCSIPSGKRLCVDGPVFSAVEFTPRQYKRDKTGRKVVC